jgi:hypothetical protein
MSNLLQSEAKRSTRSNISQDTIMHGRLARGQWISRESLRMRHGKKPTCDYLDQRPPVAGALIADPSPVCDSPLEPQRTHPADHRPKTLHTVTF